MRILELFIYYILSNRQAFKNIYSMLRPNGTMHVLLVGYHDIFEVIEFLAKDDRYSSYIKVNIIIACN